jgi:Zn-dependent peptidase ImmA (M78 family)
LGITHPPTSVDKVLEYFGLDMEVLSPIETAELCAKVGLGEYSVPAFLWSNSDSGTIFVCGTDSVVRTRMSVFHEVGHFDIPWHAPHNYLCEVNSLDDGTLRKTEREAYEYAGHLLIPDSELRRSYSVDLLSIETIETVAAMCEASFEATVIRYVGKYPKGCAAVYLQPAGSDPSTKAPYQVRYCVKSKVFHRYWKPGAAVLAHDLIDECIGSGVVTSGEVPARVFGSTKHHNYLAQFRPYGEERICALLWTQEDQLSML